MYEMCCKRSQQVVPLVKECLNFLLASFIFCSKSKEHSRNSEKGSELHNPSQLKLGTAYLKPAKIGAIFLVELRGHFLKVRNGRVTNIESGKRVIAKVDFCIQNLFQDLWSVGILHASCVPKRLLCSLPAQARVVPMLA